MSLFFPKFKELQSKKKKNGLLTKFKKMWIILTFMFSKLSIISARQQYQNKIINLILLFRKLL